MGAMLAKCKHPNPEANFSASIGEDKGNTNINRAIFVFVQGMHGTKFLCIKFRLNYFSKYFIF